MASWCCLRPRPRAAFESCEARLYYADVEAARKWYEDELGLEALPSTPGERTLRVADGVLVTLVDGARPGARHRADEPKTAALALVTDQLEAWWEYASSNPRIQLKDQSWAPRPGAPHDSFVAVDPGGYFVEFERFNASEQNRELLRVLGRLPDHAARPAGRGPGRALAFRSAVLWLYYHDLPVATRFYQQALGLGLVCDQGWAKLLQVSTGGLVGLVDESRGMKKYTRDKAVTLHLCDAREGIEAVFRRVAQDPDSIGVSPAIEDCGRSRLFSALDPGRNDLVLTERRTSTALVHSGLASPLLDHTE